MSGDNIMTTMPVAPVGNATNGENGMGSWIWILLLFMLMGGRGFGANANDGIAANAATNMVNNDFLYTQQKIDGFRQDFVGQTNLLNQNITSGIASLNAAICGIGHQIDNGFCGVNRNIDQVRFENAQNTCTITTAIGTAMQSIKDLINDNAMQDLRNKNVELAAALNNCSQTASIVNQLRPYPAPAYLTTPPGVPFAAPAFGYGCAPHGCAPHGGCC